MKELAKVFEEKCKQVYGSCNTTNYIEDEFVAIIQIKKNGENFEFDFEKNIIYNNKIKRDSKDVEYIEKEDLEIIAIILESPHKDEYDNRNNPLGPAIGQTGQNISNYLINIFNNCNEVKDALFASENTKFKILLIEAVSYQCSNGAKNIDKVNRDKLFTLVWENGGLDDFRVRLRKHNPIIVINSATGGIKNIDKNDCINGKIQEILYEFGFEIFHTPHPSSSWFWRKGLIKSSK